MSERMCRGFTLGTSHRRLLRYDRFVRTRIYDYVADSVTIIDSATRCSSI